MDDWLSALSTAEVGTVALVAAGLVVVWFRLFPLSLSVPGAETGILALQMPWRAARARAVTGAWQRRRLDGAARFSLVLDWVFIVFYVVLLAALGVLAARAAGEETVATVTLWMAVATGVLDALENAGMWLMLGGRTGAPWPLATSVVSLAKWLLLATLVVFIVVVFVADLVA